MAPQACFGRKSAGAARGPGAWVALAAAPVFAGMALIASISASSPPGMLCSAVPNVSPLSGMTLMYLLMSAFHLPAWLQKLSSTPDETD